MPVLRGDLQAEGALVEVQVGWSAGQARHLRQAQRPVPPALDARALLDTGAEITCLDTVLVQQLGLPLAQLALANVPALGGLRAGAHYHASVIVVHPDPGQALVFQHLLILEVPLTGLGYQALVGRDVLDRCDFLYGGRRQRFSLAY
jgi:Retroviral aspartyl protease